jgi:hypothetical protein
MIRERLDGMRHQGLCFLISYFVELVDNDDQAILPGG